MKNKSIWFIVSVLFVLFGLLFEGCEKKDVSPTSAGENAQDLFEGSFDSLTTYPAPTSLSYIRKDNSTATEYVFPGQFVVLINTSSSSDTVTHLINQNGGIVTAQIPNAGFYLVNINTNSVNKFLSSMYNSSFVIDVFPNSVIVGRGLIKQNKNISVLGDANSIIQTIDLSQSISCGAGIIYHKEAVGAFAAVGGISVQINDVTIPATAKTINAISNDHAMMQKLLKVLQYAQQHNLPVIINMSMGPMEGSNNTINKQNDYLFYYHYAAMLNRISQRYPNILDNVTIFISGSDKGINETSSFNKLTQTDFKGSSIWNHLYFVESQEGPIGCGGGNYLGYATIGTPNVLSAPACNVPIPNILCSATGNSFSTPFITNLVAQTYFAANQKVSVPTIADKLFQYYVNHNGNLPTVAQLVTLSGGSTQGGQTGIITGTWEGTYNFTAYWLGTSCPNPTLTLAGNIEAKLWQDSSYVYCSSALTSGAKYLNYYWASSTQYVCESISEPDSGLYVVLQMSNLGVTGVIGFPHWYVMNFEGTISNGVLNGTLNQDDANVKGSGNIHLTRVSAKSN